jgi:DNA-binding NarL/FixJ family response regulator
VKVVIADDQALLRESLADALVARGIEVIGRAGDADAVRALLATARPDVTILDIRMPPTFTTEGLRLAAEMRAVEPRPAVLLLSHHVETSVALDLLRDDPRGVGYLLKDRVTRLDALMEALERLVDGGSVVDPEIVGRLLGRRRDRDPLDELTPREREVLASMAEGRSNRGIGAALGVDEKTVEYHITQILGKLGIEAAPSDHRRVIAVLRYLRGDRDGVG